MKPLKFHFTFWLLMVTIAGTSFSGWAQSNLRVTPISGVVGQDTWRFCADGAAGMTLDVQYAVRYEDDSTATGTQDSAITFGEDGCKDVPYRDPGGVGLWFAGAYRNHAGGDWVYPEPPGVAWTIHRSGPAAAPQIDRLDQAIVNQEEVNDVMLYGSNFQTVYEVTSSGPGLPPPVKLLCVHPRGDSIAVRIDARSRQTLGFYNLGIRTRAGTASVSFQVKPQQRPFWLFNNTPEVYAGRPDQPANAYFLHIEGVNMQGITATMADGEWRFKISGESSDERSFDGILEVAPGAPPGVVTVYLNGRRVCTPEFYDYCAIPILIRAGAGALDTDKIIFNAEGDPELPQLRVTQRGGLDDSGLQFNPLVMDQMMSPGGMGEDGPDGFFLCGYVRPVFRINKQWNFAGCRGGGTFNWDCFLNREVGDLVGGISFVINFFAELDIGVHWICSWPPSWPEVCFRGVVGVEIPGNAEPAGYTFDRCFGRPEQVRVQLGRLNSLTLYGSGNGCFQIQDQWRGIPGSVYFNLLQTDCCQDLLPITASGRSAEGTRWGRSFQTQRTDSISHGPLPVPIVQPVNDCTRSMTVPGRFARVTYSPYEPTRSVDEMRSLLFSPNFTHGATYVWSRPRTSLYTGGCRISYNEAAADFPLDVRGVPLSMYGQLRRDEMDDLLLRMRLADGVPERIHLLFIKGGIRPFRGDPVRGYTGPSLNAALITDEGPPRATAHEIGHIYNLDGDWEPPDLSGWQTYNLMCGEEPSCAGAIELTYVQCGRARVEAYRRLGGVQQ